MSDEYYIDILEPSKDLNASMEALGSSIGVLYQKHWAEDLQSSYEKVFDLNIQAFANMWFDGILKLFVAKTFDGSKPLGFVVGILHRPMTFKASVFSVQDWYAGGDKRLEEALFDHVAQAIRILGCDEIWVSPDVKGELPKLASPWEKKQDLKIARFVKG